MERRVTFRSENEPSALAREVVREAQRWLVRFNPLLDDVEGLRADECRDRLRLVPGLRESGEQVVRRLREYGGPDDLPLRQTVEGAVRELDALEEALRRRLAWLAPNDPQAALDLDVVQSRLAEVAARRELAEAVGPLTQPSERLRLRTSMASWGGAFFMGLFSFGWLSFTTFHAILMIGGATKSFGGLGLALLGFYSIFFAVGIGMAYGAVMAACDEELTLEDGELVLNRCLLGLRWGKRYRLGTDSRAYVGRNVNRSDSGTSTNYYGYVLDENGREVKFGAGRPEPELERLTEKVNDHLQARRSWMARHA